MRPAGNHPTGRARPGRLAGPMQATRTTCVTLHTHKSEPVFSEPGIVDRHLEILRPLSERMGTPVVCYCYMPDHAHLLVASDHPGRLRAFVRAYKRKTWARHRREFHRPLWGGEASFYRLRKDEDLLDFAQYILENPVRAGRVHDYREYPYSGSFLWELKVREPRFVEDAIPASVEPPPEGP